MGRKFAKIYNHSEHIVVVSFNSFEPTVEEFEDYLYDLQEHYKKTDHKMVLIIDGSKARYLSSKLRIRQGKWMAQNEELTKSKCLVHIYVIPNTTIGFILKGIFIVKSPPIAYRIVKKEEEAIEEAYKTLISAGLIQNIGMEGIKKSL